MSLNKADLRKIDGFQAKWFRSISRSALPYTSRISIQRSRCKHSSAILKVKHLLLFFQSVAGYLMMMFVDDAFFNLFDIYCKAYRGKKICPWGQFTIRRHKHQGLFSPRNFILQTRFGQTSHNMSSGPISPRPPQTKT